MAERKNGSQLKWFDQYRASKTALFWACAGTAAVAVVVGFAWGGWVTGGTARTMAEQSAAQARQELASVICADRFMAAADMPAQLAALKALDRSYQQGKFVEEGGWAIMPVGLAGEAATSTSTDQRKAAALCAEILARQEVPAAAAGAVESINDTTTVAQ